MRVIIKISPEKRNKTNGAAELARALFKMTKAAYNECAADDEAYLYEPENADAMAEELELLDGATDPAGLLELARNWNAGLAEDFERALADALAKQGDATGALRWLNVPCPEVYELKKTVMALDDHFYDFAEKALLIREHGEFTTRLHDPELKDIEANPENYAAITVYPK